MDGEAGNTGEGMVTTLTAGVAGPVQLVPGTEYLYGVGCTIVYDAIVSLILLKIVDLVIGLRVDTDSEREGLDLNLHGEVVP